MSQATHEHAPGKHCRIFSTITRMEGGEGGPMRIVASDDSDDRMGDIVEQDWLLDDFSRNPVMLWGHDASIPPVGRALNLRIEDVNGHRALTFEPKFDEGPHNPLANTVAEQYRNGTLNAVSVGFRPKIVTPRSQLEETDARHANSGLILGQNVLLEISPVTIPANANALAIRSVADPSAELIEQAKAEASAIVKAALEEVPALVAAAVEASLPAEVLKAIKSPEVRKAIEGHVGAMGSGEPTLKEWLESAAPAEVDAEPKSLEQWFAQGQAPAG